jgi:hypothetical protein
MRIDTGIVDDEAQGARLLTARRQLVGFDALCDQLGFPTRPPASGYPGQLRDWPPISIADRGAEDLVLAIGRSLSRLCSGRPSDPCNVALLDSALLTARAEILAGNDDWLPDLLSSFAYLLSVQAHDVADALRVAAAVSDSPRPA